MTETRSSRLAPERRLTPETKLLSAERDAIALDGSDVRLLTRLDGLCSTAHFRLGAGRVSRAVVHRTVHEIWYVLRGRGRMWRALRGRRGCVVDLEPGQSLTLPLGTRFQFRASRNGALEILGVTIPPWPDTPDEARVVDGIWRPRP